MMVAVELLGAAIETVGRCTQKLGVRLQVAGERWEQRGWDLTYLSNIGRKETT